MTATWMVLLYGDESIWEARTPGVTEQIMNEHRAYAQACAERGYKILGGEELELSSHAINVRHDQGGPVVVADGPYVETAEHLGGYYVIETDDPHGLALLTGEMLVTESAQGGAELRPVVLHP